MIAVNYLCLSVGAVFGMAWVARTDNALQFTKWNPDIKHKEELTPLLFACHQALCIGMPHR